MAKVVNFVINKSLKNEKGIIYAEIVIGGRPTSLSIGPNWSEIHSPKYVSGIKDEGVLTPSKLKNTRFLVTEWVWSEEDQDWQETHVEVGFEEAVKDFLNYNYEDEIDLRVY